MSTSEWRSPLMGYTEEEVMAMREAFRERVHFCTAWVIADRARKAAIEEENA